MSREHGRMSMMEISPVRRRAASFGILYCLNPVLHVWSTTLTIRFSQRCSRGVLKLPFPFSHPQVCYFINSLLNSLLKPWCTSSGVRHQQTGVNEASTSLLNLPISVRPECFSILQNSNKAQKPLIRQEYLIVYTADTLSTLKRDGECIWRYHSPRMLDASRVK